MSRTRVLTLVRIRQWLDPFLRSKALKETATVTEWVYETIRQICREERNGYPYALFFGYQH